MMYICLMNKSGLNFSKVLHSWEELQNHSPGFITDQLRCPATVPSMTSIYHMVVWAELDPTHYFLLNRTHFLAWQSSLDL